MATFLRNALAAIAIAAIASAALVVLGVWLIVHDDVARLRAIERANPTPPPLLLVASIVAIEVGPCPAADESSVRSGHYESLRKCRGSTLAYTLVKSAASPPQRILYRQLKVMVKAQVVARWFTPEELWRIYAHEIYLGTIDGRQIHGLEPASRVYFGKGAHALTLPEAATITGMIHSPNAGSPFRHPERALIRRNLVLRLMLDRGYIGQENYEHAVSAPLGTTTDRRLAFSRRAETVRVHLETAPGVQQPLISAKL